MRRVHENKKRPHPSPGADTTVRRGSQSGCSPPSPAGISRVGGWKVPLRKVQRNPTRTRRQERKALTRLKQGQTYNSDAGNGSNWSRQVGAKRQKPGKKYKWQWPCGQSLVPCWQAIEICKEQCIQGDWSRVPVRGTRKERLHCGLESREIRSDLRGSHKSIHILKRHFPPPAYLSPGNVSSCRPDGWWKQSLRH